MKKLYISDLHLFDKGIIKSSNRPHKNLEEMSTDIIIKWNKKVSKEDIVYILGDVGEIEEVDEVCRILRRLNGKKVLITGNHDRETIKVPAFRKCFIQISDYFRVFDSGKKVVMSHFPFEDWEGKKKGVIHLHGHVHKEPLPNRKNRYNVGADIQDFTPRTLREIIEYRINHNRWIA